MLQDKHTLATLAAVPHTPVRHWFMEHAGWQCTLCMTPENILEEIQTREPAEFNRPPFTDIRHISDAIASGKDLFERDATDRRFALTLHLVTNPDVPQLVQSERDRYKAFLPDLSVDAKACVPPTPAEEVVMG